MSDRKKEMQDEKNLKDFLDKSDVTSQMQDAILKLIENKPDEPMVFLADYFESLSANDKSDKVTMVMRTLQLSHYSHQSFQTNLMIAYDAASVAKNPSSKKASLNRPGLIGTVFEDILLAILTSIPKDLQDLLLKRIRCRGSELVPFNIFRYSITICYVYVDFLKLCKSIFLTLCGKQASKVTDKSLCEIAVSSLKTALDTNPTVENPTSMLEAAYNIRPDRIAANFVSKKSTKAERSTMSDSDFQKEMIFVFLDKVKFLK